MLVSKDAVGRILLNMEEIYSGINLKIEYKLIYKNIRKLWDNNIIYNSMNNLKIGCLIKVQRIYHISNQYVNNGKNKNLVEKKFTI